MKEGLEVYAISTEQKQLRFVDSFDDAFIYGREHEKEVKEISRIRLDFPFLEEKFSLTYEDMKNAVELLLLAENIEDDQIKEDKFCDIDILLGQVAQKVAFLRAASNKFRDCWKRRMRKQRETARETEASDEQ